MALAAAQVIDALAELLVGLPLTGARVYSGRAWPIAAADLPAWRVTAESEDVSPANIGTLNQHELEVIAEGLHRAVDQLDDRLHELAAEGLAALFEGTPPHHLQLRGIDRTLTGEGEAAVGRITLRLLATYFVHPAAPETIVS